MNQLLKEEYELLRPAEECGLAESLDSWQHRETHRCLRQATDIEDEYDLELEAEALEVLR